MPEKSPLTTRIVGPGPKIIWRGPVLQTAQRVDRQGRVPLFYGIALHWWSVGVLRSPRKNP